MRTEEMNESEPWSSAPSMRMRNVVEGRGKGVFWMRSRKCLGRGKGCSLYVCVWEEGNHNGQTVGRYEGL